MTLKKRNFYYFIIILNQEIYNNTTTTSTSETTSSNNNNNNNETHLIEDIPLGLVHKLEKIHSPYNNSSTDLIGIVVICKNARRLVFLKEKEDDQFEKSVYNNLVKYAFPLKSNQAFFAFNHKTTSDKIDEGWLVYNAQQEYERMGVNESKSKWRITTINKDYKYCETYPNLLAVCHSTSDKELELIAEFRSRNRIPVLSWVKSSSTIT